MTYHSSTEFVIHLCDQHSVQYKKKQFFFSIRRVDNMITYAYKASRECGELLSDFSVSFWCYLTKIQTGPLVDDLQYEKFKNVEQVYTVENKTAREKQLGEEPLTK